MTDTGVGVNDATPLPVTLRVGDSAAWVDWELTLRADGLQFRRERESVDIKDADLSGITQADSIVSLHSAAGTTVQLRGGAQLTEVVAAINARICRLHEVTRPLRAFGARRGRPGEDHDRFFEPLMSARSQAESEKEAAGRLAAFHGERIRSSTDQTLQSFAATRFPNSPPERRALFETLNEQVQSYYGALDKLDVAALAAGNAGDVERFTRWRDWVKAVDAVFVAADQCWLNVLPLLDRAKTDGPGGLRGMFRKSRR